MKDDISDIRRYYDQGAAIEEDRLARHPLEFEITCRHLDRHLPKSGSVLEIGAGPGRYTEYLLQRGLEVTAVDVSADLLKLCEERVHKAGLASGVTFKKADARDLTGIKGGPFDAVLLMGPLYHLVEEEDRHLAVEQAQSNLVDGGLVAGAFISKYGMLSDLIENHSDWIMRRDEVRSIMAIGRDPVGQKEGFRGYFAEPSEIVPFFESRGFETLTLAGVEPVVSAFDASFNRLDEPLRSNWFDLLIEISTEPTALGASCHLLYIGQSVL